MMKKTISTDLRQRILKAYDSGRYTRPEVAQRFEVSLGLVKKLLVQRKRIGDIAPQHHRSGRKGFILGEQQSRLRELLKQKPDMTLEEMRHSLDLDCTLPAIHYVLVKMGVSYKKKRSEPASRTVPTSRARAGSGGGAKAVSTRRASCSSMRAGPRRT